MDEMDEMMEAAGGTKQHRARWAGIGAAVAVVLGAGGLMTATAVTNTAEHDVFVAITPCRVMDTRPAPTTVGPRPTPLGAAETYTIAITGANGNCTIPPTATAVSLNVTAVNPTADSFVTVFPADAARPVASNLNVVSGQNPVPNAVTVDLSADGRVSFFNNGGTVDVLADIVGYYEDHNHDDRYYTKTETNAHEAQQKYLNIDLLGTETGASIYIRSTESGLDFKDNSTTQSAVSFVAPPDLTPGSNMTLNATFSIGQVGCTVSLRPFSIYVTRVGDQITNATVPKVPNPVPGFVAVGGDPRNAPTPGGTVSVMSFTLGRSTDGSGFQPGDAITLLFDRNGAVDTCVAPLIVTGMQVVYS